MLYTASNWYWIVAGSTTQVFSSARAMYVPVTDATYVAWIAAGGNPTRIASEAELFGVLTDSFPAGLPAGAGGTGAYHLDATTQNYLTRARNNSLEEIDAWLDANTGNVTQIRAIIKMLVRVQVLQIRKAAI